MIHTSSTIDSPNNSGCNIQRLPMSTVNNDSQYQLIEECISNYIVAISTHFQAHNMLSDGRYRYTTDLLALSTCEPADRSILPEFCQRIITPLVAESWEQELEGHRDGDFCKYILDGIKNGFKIGFQRGRCARKSAVGNMASTMHHPEPVTEYLATEVKAGRIVEIPKEYTETVQISRFGVIPKSNQPGKWRLVLDLSSPDGASVNDGIDSELCSIAFASVDTAIEKIVGLGRGSLLAKVDIEHAYRNVPIHPADRQLLGMRWKQKLYIDTVLPFGLRSAPKIFSALADALEWILFNRGVSTLIHYLDDFLTMGCGNTSQCSVNLNQIQDTCKLLGIPLKRQKIEGPDSRMTFLGIELDTTTMEARLPKSKLDHLKEVLHEWSNKKSCQKRNLLSLIGKLSHACKVVLAGRIFLRRMIDRAKTVRRLNHWVHLTAEFHADLAWWQTFLEYWNGCSMMQVHCMNQVPDRVVATDASGSWGCGAIWGNQWLQCQWENEWKDRSIAVKELLPIVLAVAVWGQQWRHQLVVFKCDNMAVVQIVNAQNCRDPLLVQLLRYLHFYTAVLDIRVRANHIEGVNNSIADAISRNHLQVLFQLNKDANPTPTPIPRSTWELLFTQGQDWRSATWRSLLRTSLGTAWHQAPKELTRLLKPST